MQEVADPRRWLVLAAGLGGLIAGCAVQYGLPFLIPAFREQRLELEAATLLVIAPVVGVLAALIAWGAAADRWGERLVLSAGLVGAGLALVAAAAVDALPLRWLFLCLAGGSSAAIHAASGRLILAWFGPGERGLAMGIRQAGLPLGIAVSAMVLPALAADSIATALLALAGGVLVASVLIVLVVRDPPRRRQLPGDHLRAAPYREAFLWRIHAASAMLVIPQYAVAVFAFDYLVTGLGWADAGAGALLATTQVVGAAGRLVVGWWSDRVGSRLYPMRMVAATITVVMGLLALSGLIAPGVAVVVLAVAATITLAPNGLAFAAVAERAGSRWAGRALGVQNTFQNATGVLVAPPLAFVISTLGAGSVAYAAAFGLTVAFPLAAVVTIPVRDETPIR